MSVPQLAALAAIALVAASCSGQDRVEPSSPRAEDAPLETRPTAPSTSENLPQAARLPQHLPAVALEGIHPFALATCRRGQLVAVVCPRRVPAAFYPKSGIFFSGSARSGVVNIESGGEYPSQPERNRPPGVAHLVVYVGRPTLASDVLFAELWPREEPARAARNGLMRVGRKHAVYLGRVRWAGRTGELVLAPPFPLGGMNGNHLAFRWQARGREHAVTLHGWEPFLETVGTLRAIVRSIPEDPE